jgi:tRNA-dihydrouridine synthase C
MRDLLPSHRPALVLAPMQDITRLPFMRVLARRGAPDIFVTEYFRVHPASRPDRALLRALTDHGTGRPVFAQLIGDDLPSLIRTVRELADYPSAGIDLNLGCPAPIVCRKNAGGGLLRDPQRLRRLLGDLRAAIAGRFTVKTRLGYADAAEFDTLLEIFRASGIDGLTIHARTVKQCYQGPVATAPVRAAVAAMPCPVVANGNIVDVATARAFHRQTGAAGLMVGRGAIRNPWIFAQLRAAWEGAPAPVPSHRDLLAYIRELCDETAAVAPHFCPLGHVQQMKRTLNYVSHGIADGFEYELRRCRTPDEMREICRRHLDHPTPLPVLPPADSGIFSGFTALH